MKKRTIAIFAIILLAGITQAQTSNVYNRALWASINGTKNASLGDYQQYTGKVLVSWRMLPGDDATTGFDLYRTISVNCKLKKGIYIHNGKKIYIR